MYYAVFGAYSKVWADIIFLLISPQDRNGHLDLYRSTKEAGYTNFICKIPGAENVNSAKASATRVSATLFPLYMRKS
jgi:hypothetical protein